MSSIRKVTKVSKIDVNSGFWTLLMDDQSQLLTTFNTPWGRYCFIKMPFGLNQAQYFFQYYMDTHFQDINSTMNVIADDVMIHGESDDQHDRHLLQVLNKCREIRLKLNPDKCQFGQKQVQFYGNTISSEGVKPDPAKVYIIIKMPSPKSKVELASFLGMCNYLSTYIPWLSDITTTLRQLNKKSVKFVWNSTYERAFRQAKLHVTNAVTLQYFDPGQPIVLECDASGNGVGGTLLQNGQPIIFISQALTDTQKRYSNIERELLAMVVIIEKLHHYIFGRHFTVHTDHSPLVNLFEKCLNDTSPRFQCLLLCLTQYQMQVKYVTHKCVPIADCMSHLVDSTSEQEDPTLNLQITDVTRSNVNWNQIKLACLEDPTMIQLACTIQRGWPDTAKDLPIDVKPYFQYRYILHIVDGIIFLQNRIVIPMGLRNAFLQKIHDAHLGIVKSKLLGWTLIYWPNWNSDMETTCQNCTLCRENQPMPANVPKFQVKASSPGEIYGIDITEIHGKSHIVCVDYFTCCIFERELRSLHSTDVIDALKSIFCDVRALDKIISDNARYFMSEEFQGFHNEMVNTPCNFISTFSSWQCSHREGCPHCEADLYES